MTSNKCHNTLSYPKFEIENTQDTCMDQLQKDLYHLPQVLVDIIITYFYIPVIHICSFKSNLLGICWKEKENKCFFYRYSSDYTQEWVCNKCQVREIKTGNFEACIIGRGWKKAGDVWRLARQSPDGYTVTRKDGGLMLSNNEYRIQIQIDIDWWYLLDMEVIGNTCYLLTHLQAEIKLIGIKLVSLGTQVQGKKVLYGKELGFQFCYPSGGSALYTACFLKSYLVLKVSASTLHIYDIESNNILWATMTCYAAIRNIQTKSLYEFFVYTDHATHVVAIGSSSTL